MANYEDEDALHVDEVISHGGFMPDGEQVKLNADMGEERLREIAKRRIESVEEHEDYWLPEAHDEAVKRGLAELKRIQRPLIAEQRGREAAREVTPLQSLTDLLEDPPDLAFEHPRRFAEGFAGELEEVTVDEAEKAVRSARTEHEAGAQSSDHAEGKLDDALRALRSHRHGEFRAGNEATVLAEAIDTHFGDSEAFLEAVKERI